MKIYFKTREQARNHKHLGTVQDCKLKPSANGSRWAVELYNLVIVTGKQIGRAHV